MDYDTLEISIHPNSNIKSIKFLLNGKLHNSRGPAKLIYSESEELLKEYYYINGKKSRLYAPAVITYFAGAKPLAKKLEYFYKGYRHNKYGPAIIRLDKYGNKKYETYYNMGVLHNTEGPACHNYIHNKKRWIINGIEQH